MFLCSTHMYIMHGNKHLVIDMYILERGIPYCHSDVFIDTIKYHNPWLSSDAKTNNQ